MRAIGLTEFGGPEVLRVLELPEPEPGPGEVRIRVHAAAVNPTDTMLRSGAARDWFGGRPGPYVPGMDLAGVIDAIDTIDAATETPFRPGDPVIAIVDAYAPRGGAYAELVVVPAASVVAMPTGVDFPAASTLLMKALTARLALDRSAVPPGGTIAVTGSAGAVGGFAVQLGRGEGLRVLADADAADVRLVASLGADEVVARGDDVARRFRALAPGGVDAVLDAAALNGLVLPAIRDGGGLAVLRRGWDGPADRGIQVHRIMVTPSLTDQERLQRLSDQAGRGELTLRVADVLPADQAARAHRRLAEGRVRGRLVLDLTGL